jgi:hypothetical protein
LLIPNKENGPKSQFGVDVQYREFLGLTSIIPLF